MESDHFKEKYERGDGSTIYELACPCCGANEVTLGALEKLELMRYYYRGALGLNSAYRCPKHNDELPNSKPTSSHPKGCAFDVKVSGSVHRLLLVHAALRAGFRRIGIADTFIHVDCDPDKPECLWLYS